MAEYKFVFGNTIIDYSLRYAVRSTLGIKVHPDNSVHITAPLHTEMEKIEEKIKTKAPWILKQQDFFLAFHPITPIRKFVSGETHLYLGKQYRLKIIESPEKSVKLKGKYIIISTPSKNENLKIENQLKAWYTKKALTHFELLFKKQLESFSLLITNQPKLKYKWMQKRWGSCDQKGTIILNTELIKASKKCIEYVVLHEMCHLVHLNHTAEFYQLLETNNPNWRKIKHELECMLV